MAAPSSWVQGHIAGLRAAKAAFQALPELTRARLLTATETTLSEVVRHAKSRISASPSIRTRALLNSIQYTINKNNGRGKAGVANVTTTVRVDGARRRIKGVLVPAKNVQGVRLVVPKRYARFVEFGTKSAPSEPFMLPAARSQERPYLERVTHAVKRAAADVAAIGLRND